MGELDSRDPERIRLRETRKNQAAWKKWGHYLRERQWGTVRDDYREKTGSTG
jgi:hypothetical protein